MIIPDQVTGGGEGEKKVMGRVGDGNIIMKKKRMAVWVSLSRVFESGTT